MKKKVETAAANTQKKNYITIFYVFKLARKSNLEPRINKKRIKGRSDARSNTQTNHNKHTQTNKQTNTLTNSTVKKAKWEGEKKNRFIFVLSENIEQ